MSKNIKHAKRNDFQVLEEIGRGSFGSVRRVIYLPSQTTMVRKEIKYGHMNSKERQQLISECSIISQLHNENIVNFFNWDFDEVEEILYLYMEYCDGGDLTKMIKKYKNERKYIPEKIVWNIFAQVLMALYTCHYGEELQPLTTVYDRMKQPGGSSSKNNNNNNIKKSVVIHRDLKPGNIFLSIDGSSNDNNNEGQGVNHNNGNINGLLTNFRGYDRGGRNDSNERQKKNNNNNNNSDSDIDYNKVLVKLGDFGLAKSLETSIQFATTYVGTPYYMSPEVLNDKPYSPLSDIWSLGCVIFEMCSLHPPFQAKTYMELTNKIKSGKFERIPEYYSNGLNSIIHSMVDVNLKTRPSTFELLQDIQIRTARKSLQLERFERNLLDYEKELINIEKLLEKQANDYDKGLAQLKDQFGQAVEDRVRDILNGNNNNNKRKDNYNFAGQRYDHHRLAEYHNRR